MRSHIINSIVLGQIQLPISEEAETRLQTSLYFLPHDPLQALPSSIHILHPGSVSLCRGFAHGASSLHKSEPSGSDELEPRGPCCPIQAPRSPQALFMKGTSLPAPGLERDAAPFCIWFLTRHQSCGSLKEFCPHGASLLSPVQRSRADCEATASASQQGLSDLSQTGSLQAPRAAELISCPDVSLALFSVYSCSSSLSLLPSPPTGKHG